MEAMTPIRICSDYAFKYNVHDEPRHVKTTQPSRKQYNIMPFKCLQYETQNIKKKSISAIFIALLIDNSKSTFSK